jgi:hypothetical protein
MHSKVDVTEPLKQGINNLVDLFLDGEVML